eukprot:scaffold223119_cov30-Tisochrysis_lutea.AAC.1
MCNQKRSSWLEATASRIDNARSVLIRATSSALSFASNERPKHVGVSPLHTTSTWFQSTQPLLTCDPKPFTSYGIIDKTGDMGFASLKALRSMRTSGICSVVEPREGWPGTYFSSNICALAQGRSVDSRRQLNLMECGALHTSTDVKISQ